MKHREDYGSVAVQPINHQERRPRDRQFPCPWHAAGTPEIRVQGELPHALFNLLHQAPAAAGLSAAT